MATMIRKSVSGAVELKEGPAGEGLVQAVFCTFDVVDRDGDVVLKSAFTDGQKVKMMWAHDDSRWIGDGTITTTAKEAIFTGEFWMDTQDGAEAFRKVRRATARELAEWSWSFNVPAGASKYGKFGQENVRYLGVQPLEIFEVSPVATGAGVDTRTTAIKSRIRKAAKALVADPETLAMIGQIDFLTDNLDELVDALMDAAGLVDPDELALPAAGQMGEVADGHKLGRAIARTRREQIQASITALRTQAAALEKLLAEADPGKAASHIRAMRMRAALGEARARGGYADVAI